jgi:hypothetical protein
MKNNAHIYKRCLTMENQTSQIVEAGHTAKGNFTEWGTGT